MTCYDGFMRQPVDLDDSEIRAIAGELRALVGKLRRRLAEQSSPGDYTPSQLSVASLLHRGGPTTLTALARAEGMRPQSMSAIVSVLEAGGLVRGSQDPSDGRQTILSLTEHAIQSIEAGRTAKDDWLSGVIRSKLSSREQAELVHALALLNRLLEP
jgi:DNA-binding MarR family transcriptional regulator